MRGLTDSSSSLGDTLKSMSLGGGGGLAMPEIMSAWSKASNIWPLAGGERRLLFKC